jgi:hypothetical protein
MASTTDDYLGSVYSEEDKLRLRRDVVDLPPRLVSFFQQYVHNYLPARQNTVSPSYLHVEGLHPERLPQSLMQSEEALGQTEEWPVRNATDEDEVRAAKTVDCIAKSMFGQGVYENVRRWYKIHGTTQPIRVSARDRFTSRAVEFYVKRPDINRLIGNFIYSVIAKEPQDREFTGQSRQLARYAFNRACFVEETVPGTQVTERLEARILAAPQSFDDTSHCFNRERYIEGLVRASMHVDFMGIFQDVSRTANRIMDSQYRTCLFDFNIIYNAPLAGNQNALISHLLKYGVQMNDHLFEVQCDEMRNVRVNVEQSQAMRKLVTIAGDLPDFSGNTINERIKKWYNATSFEDYIARKLDEYTQTGKRMKGSHLRQSGRIPRKN